jgi:hypothetical protein
LNEEEGCRNDRGIPTQAIDMVLPKVGRYYHKIQDIFRRHAGNNRRDPKIQDTFMSHNLDFGQVVIDSFGPAHASGPKDTHKYEGGQSSPLQPKNMTRHHTQLLGTLSLWMRAHTRVVLPEER